MIRNIKDVSIYMNNIVNTNARMNRNPIANRTETPAGMIVASSGSGLETLPFFPSIFL